MTLEELELEPPVEVKPMGSFTIRTVADDLDTQTAVAGPCINRDPDFHLGAVSE